MTEGLSEYLLPLQAVRTNCKQHFPEICRMPLKECFDPERMGNLYSIRDKGLSQEQMAL
jgi:hypothetical protein